MKLDDFLKVKKVRCVDDDGCNDLTIGKEYEVTRLSLAVHIIDDDDGEYSYQARRFEPVLVDNRQVNIQDIGTDILDTNANIKDTPKFKVGDPVYWGLKSRIFKVYRLMTANVLQVELDDCVVDVHKDELCLATLENYGKLCSLFERIDFEAPPKELTGSDLARAMLEKGWHLVPCVVSDVSDSDALNNDNCCLVDEWCVNYFESDGYRYEYAVPFDPRTGEPLTESILND